MALVDINEACLSFGGPPLLDRVSLHIERGDRLCLLGRNGAGKSTLLKVLAGKLTPDEGQLIRRQGVRVELLDQEVPQDTAGSVFDLVAVGLGALGKLLAKYQRLQRQEGADLEPLQAKMEELGGWGQQHRIETVLTRLGLNGDDQFSKLSGGWRRRVWLARKLVAEPDVLLLDEPTNHLDINAIEWLEGFLLGYGGALVLVTHDRSFMQRLATSIAEIDQGRLLVFPGDYPKFLQYRETLFTAEERQNEAFERKLAGEEVWIRQGIKARRTRNEGRVRALEQMRRERQNRRRPEGAAKLRLEQGEQAGKLVCEAEDLEFAYGESPVLKEVSLRLMRGDKVGLIGPNGAGKTTLLRLLVGDLEPQKGRIHFGVRVKPAYFDQMRAQLDENLSVAENVGQGRDTIQLGNKSQHLNRYLQNFLFSPQRARTPVRTLSGGERNRVMLARLFSRPANMLVLDEPTNDLDVETLELLEALLVEFTGTILLVSHDRTFLDNVVTSTLVFEGEGRVKEYIGGYGDWLRQRQATGLGDQNKKSPAKKQPQRNRSTKLTFRQKRELEELPGLIEDLELAQTQAHEQMADPEFYRSDKASIGKAQQQLAQIEKDLEEAYARWASLEEVNGN